MAVGRDLLGKNNHVIAVIGDGAMSAGMAYEAVNNAGHLRSRLLVVLNDNDMSIAPATGALNKHLNHLAETNSSQHTLFEKLGMKHIGPIDGHDVNALAEAFWRKSATTRMAARCYSTSARKRARGTRRPRPRPTRGTPIPASISSPAR